MSRNWTSYAKPGYPDLERKFDGKTYKRNGGALDKKTLERNKKIAKQKGFSYRSIKQNGKYFLYLK
jgi:hypothetical protein